jgi:hypothetical protein
MVIKARDTNAVIPLAAIKWPSLRSHGIVSVVSIDSFESDDSLSGGVDSGRPEV